MVAPPVVVRPATVPKVTGKGVVAGLTAAGAGLAVFLLCLMNEAAQRQFGVTLWIPPFGAMALLFASQAVAAAQANVALKPKDLTQKLAAVIGSVLLTVVLVQVVGGPTPAGRAAAVVGASLLMSVIPGGAFFAPTGGLCTAYTDQSMLKGWLENPYYEFALFPCAFGLTWLLLSTHFFASSTVYLLRLVRARTRRQRFSR